MITHTLELATTQDKSIVKETLIEILSGDLFLRDMGYFCLSGFREIEKRNAYYLRPLQLTTNVFLHERQSSSPDISPNKVRHGQKMG